MKVLIFIVVLMQSLGAQAQEEVKTTIALTFQNWKEQQILEAQNQTLRVSSKITQLKASKTPSTNVKPIVLPSSKIKKTEVDPILAAEKDLRRAQESLEAANNLGLEEYVTIYLPSLKGEPEAINSLAQRLSKEELAEIFKTFVESGGGLSVSSRGKIQ